LRTSSSGMWFYGTLCAIYSSLPFIVAPQRFRDVANVNDFANYWSAGATVGSGLLTDPGRLEAWEAAHDVAPHPFVYPPGFAWFYAPFAHFPPMTALMIELVVMIALFGLAALLIAEIYGFPRWFAALGVFAWGPTVSTIEAGQNTGLALVLMLTAILALASRRPLLLGVAVGLLLYKPTDALAFLLLLLVRREWRALAVATLFGLGWYVLSVGASGGDWLWPIAYANTVHAWYAANSSNPYQVFTVPTLLLAAQTPVVVAVATGAIVLISALPLLARVSGLEAASMATLVGLAASVHAWPYSAAVMLPAVCYAMTSLPNSLRLPIIIAAYVGAAVGVSTAYGGYALAMVCVGGTLWWLLTGYRAGSRAPLAG